MSMHDIIIINFGSIPKDQYIFCAVDKHKKVDNTVTIKLIISHNRVIYTRQ